MTAAVRSCPPWLTRAQAGWLLLQLVAFLAVAAAAPATGLGDLSLLLREPLGQKLLIAAGVCLLLNTGILTAGFALLNRTTASGRPGVSRTATVVLCAGCFVLLFLPEVFVVLNGPAAVSVAVTLGR
jgi:hypothetical protein